MKTPFLCRRGANRKLPSALLILFGCIATAHAASTWDLKKDWSDAANPNGVWSLKEGNNPLPAVPLAGWQPGNGWTSPQPGWAESATANNRIPFWFRSNGTETFSPDTLAGDIVVHTQDDFNGVGNGVANVTWTSPVAGTISIAGSVWMTRDIGRSNNWNIYRNAALLSSGAVSSGDAYNRANPFSFAAGSGGATAVQNLSVVAGDVIKLELVRTSAAGDFVGINLKIVAGSVWNTGPGANGHTYIPVSVPAGITWQAAENAAVAAGGHLASIESADENAFVYSTVSGTASYWFTNDSGQAIGPWLGGNQVPIGTEPAQGWQWVGGNGFSYTNWAASQPDNANSGTDDRTIFFHPTAATGSVWNDYPAVPATDLPKSYIIEIGPTEGSSTVWNTGPGANGHSYQAVLVPGGITWPEAEAAAVARGGHLVSVNSSEENDFAYSLVSGRPEFWYLNEFNAAIGPFIGAFQPDGSSEPGGGFQWTDGSPFTYTRWSGGEPNNSGGVEKYAHFYGSGVPNSAWNDISLPALVLGYIIEFATPPGVPAWPEFADMLYVAAQTSNVVHQYRIDPVNPPALMRSLTSGMDRPSGLAVSADNKLIVVQRGNLGGSNSKVSFYHGADDDPAFTNFFVPTSPLLNAAHGVVFRGNDLLIVDSWNNRVRRFQPDGAGGYSEQLPSITAGIVNNDARFIIVNPSTQEVFVSVAESSNKILRYHISSGGAITPNGEITGNGMSNAHGIAFSPWGELFVAGYGSSLVSRFTFDGSGNASANGTISGNGVTGPITVAFSPWGELFVGNTGTSSISRFTFSSTGVAQANGTMTVPSTNVTVLQFVAASAPEVPAPCVPGVTTSVTDGLIAWWKGDGNANDFTGNNNGTEENGVTYEPGRFGQAFRVGYNGSTSPRVNMGHLPQLKGAAAYTVSMWLKYDSAATGGYPTLCLPVGNIPPSPSGSFNNSRGFYFNGPSTYNSQQYFTPGFIAGSIPLQFAASTVYQNPAGGAWNHFAGVWRSSDGFYGLYMDGVLKGSGNAAAGARFPDGIADLAPGYIGAFTWCSGSSVYVQNTSVGTLFDDVRIYTRDLAPAEIALIASGDDFNTCPPPDTGLPPLTSTRVPAGVRLSWPLRYTGWSLESSTDITAWTPVTGTPLRDTTDFLVTVPASPVRQFFRLRPTGS